MSVDFLHQELWKSSLQVSLEPMLEALKEMRMPRFRSWMHFGNARCFSGFLVDGRWDNDSERKRSTSDIVV